MKRIICHSIFILMVIVGQAQTISVSSFRLLDTDLTANTAGTMEIDQNGETAALIKVVTTQTGFTFDGGAMGIVKTLQKPSEIWVYVPKGLKRISISHPQLGLLRDYYLNIPIESARTYEMVLVSGEVQTLVKKVRTSQFVVFNLSPKDAVVEINGELLKTKDGTASKLMAFGEYNYKIQAPNYLPEAGIVTIDNPDNKIIVNATLKPNFSEVTLSVNNDAEIWVNGEKFGNGRWTGQLGAGIYELEAKKSNYRSTSITKEISPSSNLITIQLEEPKPIYSDCEISSSPEMADIYIDDKYIGQSPLIVQDLIIGDHLIRASKKGYTDYRANFNVKEGETTALSLELGEEQGVQTYKIDNVEYNMVLVEGGSYCMESDGVKNNVTLSSYYIGETEVTQELWNKVMGDNPSEFDGIQTPVENISWNQCIIFIKKLNIKTGAKFRFPTEAEWEFAASGGQASNGFIYCGSNDLDEVGWFQNNCDVPQNVKTKKPNELGLYDMSGNVWEWCSDEESIISNSSKLNTQCAKGGGFNSGQYSCDYKKRNTYQPGYSNNNLGLRLALSE